MLSAVAEDLVILHPADHMLHPRSDLAVRGIVCFLARERPSGAFSVRHDHPAVDVGTIAENGHVLTALGQSGGAPGVGVRGGARHRTGGRDHETCLGTHDDLEVRGEPVVAAGRTDLPVRGRDEGAVRNPQPVSGIGRRGEGLQREHWSEPLDHLADGGGGDAEQRPQLPRSQARPVLRRDDQHPLRQRQTPRSAPHRVVAAPLPHHLQQSRELRHPQPRGHPHPFSTQHLSHTPEMPSSRPCATPFGGCPVSPAQGWDDLGAGGLITASERAGSDCSRG